MAKLGTVNGNHKVRDITEIVEDHGTYYIVMPTCDGGVLFDLLATAEEIPEKECKRIMKDILTAVGHLHKYDMIHRDIRPESILFDSSANKGPSSLKTVKLMDFDTVVEWTPQSPKTKTFAGITFHAATSPCETGAQWRRAWSPFSAMPGTRRAGLHHMATAIYLQR